MRNSTKLRRILEKFDVNMHMDEDGIFKMIVFNKETNEKEILEADTYAILLNKGLSLYNKKYKILCKHN